MSSNWIKILGKASRALRSPGSAFIHLALRVYSSFPRLATIYPTSLLLKPAGNLLHARQLIRLGEPTKAFQTLDKACTRVAYSTKAQAERKLLGFALAQIVGESAESSSRSAVDSRHVDSPRIAFWLSSYPPASANGYALRSEGIVQALISAGLEVTVIHQSNVNMPTLLKTHSAKNLRVYAVPSRTSDSPLQDTVNRLTNLLTILSREECSLLHTTTNFEFGSIGARAAQILNIPWIYELRGELHSTWVSRFPKEQEIELESSEYYQTALKSERLLARAADAVVALSEVGASHLLDFSPERLAIVPNGHSSELLQQKFSPSEVRDDLGLEGDKFFGSVSSIVHYEGFETAIRALAYLQDDWKFLLVGHGPYLADLQALAEQLGVLDRVVFAGQQSPNDIARWYQSIDVFVVPRKDLTVSRYVTPLKASLAQAMGIPVVASDLPALREVTANLETYFEADNPKALAEAISKASTRSRREPRPTAAHSWDSRVSPLITLYSELEQH